MNISVTVGFDQSASAVLTGLAESLKAKTSEGEIDGEEEKPKTRGRPKKVEGASMVGSRKRGRPKKEVEPEEIEEEAENDEYEDDEEIEETTNDEEFEETEDDEVVTPDEQKKIKAALREYVAKNGKNAAVAILSKFGKSSAHVLKKDKAKLLKALKV